MIKVIQIPNVVSIEAKLLRDSNPISGFFRLWCLGLIGVSNLDPGSDRISNYYPNSVPQATVPKFPTDPDPPWTVAPDAGGRSALDVPDRLRGDALLRRVVGPDGPHGGVRGRHRPVPMAPPDRLKDRFGWRLFYTLESRNCIFKTCLFPPFQQHCGTLTLRLHGTVGD